MKSRGAAPHRTAGQGRAGLGGLVAWGQRGRGQVAVGLTQAGGWAGGDVTAGCKVIYRDLSGYLLDGLYLPTVSGKPHLTACASAQSARPGRDDLMVRSLGRRHGMACTDCGMKDALEALEHKFAAFAKLLAPENAKRVERQAHRHLIVCFQRVLVGEEDACDMHVTDNSQNRREGGGVVLAFSHMLAVAVVLLTDWMMLHTVLRLQTAARTVSSARPTKITSTTITVSSRSTSTVSR
eukprot:COSAG01_NODE_1083_length_11812_cov_9.648510_8_plen_238_part_00